MCESTTRESTMRELPEHESTRSESTKPESSSPFDATASAFDRYRSLPSGVAEAVRSALFESVDAPSPARVLDLGAGTGRFGKAFVAANDLYVGVDLSWEMLRRFLAGKDEMRGREPCLAQAEGQRLPFRDGAFDVVMLMQVLSGARDWRPLLGEARRVLRPGGLLAAGHTVAPPAGVDRQLKKQLAAILEDMGVEERQAQEGRGKALAWLEESAIRHRRVVAATWPTHRTPREFLLRHRTGARFSTLPPLVQEDALHQLSAWAETVFGSLDTVFPEDYSFDLDLFEFV